MNESNPCDAAVRTPLGRRSAWAQLLALTVLAGGLTALLLAAGGAAESGGEGGAVQPVAGDAAVRAAAPVKAARTPADPRSVEYPRWRTPEPGDTAGYNQRASLVQRGREVYNKYCVGCHGVYGDGKGPAAERLITQPRDFTSGIYKFRSTDSSSLPLEADLHRTLTRGLSQVSMPGFPLMPEAEKAAVIEYIKAFYKGWDEEALNRKVVTVPAAPADLAAEERVMRGRIVYLAMQCGKCHGSDGAGAGATQTEYVDAWGHNQKPFNFTRGRLKGGDDPEDIYRTFHTGLRSIMPAYNLDTLAAANVETFQSQAMFLQAGEMERLQAYLEQFPATAGEVFSAGNESQRRQLGERNSWDLVAYVLSLRKDTSTATAVLGEKIIK